MKFWGLKSLVGFRYGKEHHAVVAATVMHVPDGAPQGACTKSFEDWAMPWVQAFEVELERDPPRALPWKDRIVDVDVLYARAATLAARAKATPWRTGAWPGVVWVLPSSRASPSPRARTSPAPARSATASRRRSCRACR